MENRSSFLRCLSLGIFLLFLGHANAENRTEPRKNANLSPFEGWRSAYFCLKNVSTNCSIKATLTLTGWLEASREEIDNFCHGGCYEHTLDVIKCIRDVKKDFYFANKAPWSYIKETLRDSCASQKGFNITSYKDPNSATSFYGRFYMPLVSTLTTLAFISTFM